MRNELWKTVLTMIAVAWLLAACRTTSTVEKRTEHVENRNTMKVDSVALHTADSVLMMVDKSDSLVRIVERTVKWREKVKVVRDTVVVYARNDSIVKVESVRQQTSRSPPRWKRTLALVGILTIVALAAVKLRTIKKLFKL